MTEFTTSADGTRLAYDRTGDGPAVVLIGGSLANRYSTRPLSKLLADEFTVYDYDRRARGESGDTLPYAQDREYEDLQAIIEVAGGEAMAYAHSSGAQLALEAATRGIRMSRLAIYEPPYEHADEPKSQELPNEVRALAARGEFEQALVVYMEILGNGPGQVEAMKALPSWPRLVEISNTLPYDLEFVKYGLIPYDRFAAIGIPVLVLAGGRSPGPMQLAMDVLVKTIPGSTGALIDGERHVVRAAALEPVLREFFRAG